MRHYIRISGKSSDSSDFGVGVGGRRELGMTNE